MDKLLVLTTACLTLCWGILEATAKNVSRKDFALPAHITFPDSAPFNSYAAALGKMLFFDPRLSREQNIACVTCHNPSFGWENPEPRTVGAMNAELSRHTPTIANLYEAPYLFRDGSSPNLEEQARDALIDPQFMGAEMSEVIALLKSIPSYKKWFDLAFPKEGVTEDTIVRAIATFERTVVTGRTLFDDWIEGNEEAISESAKRGFEAFIGKGQCATCHTGWAFTDHKFYDTGLPTNDIGRGKIAPKNIAARHAFKTPGLRNITLRAPYMHDGSLPSLRSVINHYRSGGIRRASRAQQIEEINLEPDDIEDLLAFLSALTEKETHVQAPALPTQ